MNNHYRRLFAGVAATVAAAVCVFPLAAMADAASRTPKPKPTIILEPGAFADGCSWNRIIAGLRRDGYPLRGVASDAAAPHGLIAHIDGLVILIGHSCGGSVISAAGTGNSKVKALVYVAAFLPEAGESVLGPSTEFPGSTRPDALETVTGPDLYIRQDAFHGQFAADVPARRAALMAASERPVAQAVPGEKATASAWWETHVTEVAASHAVAVSPPGVVIGVIETGARATR
ncbi:alpha/beta hydrolase [Nonomuraea sp. JJY05]|uniref:alpha/beta hydrolase n=1 Tax=Nonomuraea sp. JJY05 TaxID=3350255 RepID=UPI00373E7D80